MADPNIKELRNRSNELRAAYLDAKGELDDAKAREAEAWRAWSAAFDVLEKAEDEKSVRKYWAKVMRP